MVKTADSAAIRENIPTRPREGSVHAGSFDDRVNVALLNRVLLPYSYFQSGSSGCLMSQSGRRLLTTGILAKLYSMGGELADHSKVHASHGSLPAGLPLKQDQSRFPTNTAVPAI